MKGSERGTKGGTNLHNHRIIASLISTHSRD